MKYKNRTIGDKLFDLLVIVSCTLLILIILYPLYFVVIASVSNPTQVANGQVWLYPKGFNLRGYQEILNDTRIWVGYKNTLIYTIGGTLISLMCTLPAAFALSRWDFKAKGIIMLYFTFTMFFSGGLIPTYLTVKNLGVDNTIWMMMLPFCVSIYNLIITRTFFQTNIPKEMIEAAKMDGCSDFRMFIYIVLPLSKAVISVIALYYAVGYWNEYFRGLLYLRNAELYPLQLILRDILVKNQSMAATSTGYAEAQKIADLVKYGVIVVSTAPIIIIYPFIQKYFEKGIMIGSIKG